MIGKFLFLVVILVLGTVQGAPLQSQPPPPDSKKIVSADSAKTVKTFPDSQSNKPVFLHRADTVAVVKPQFNHREQIITGSVIMACLVGMLVVMNNYNPR